MLAVHMVAITFLIACAGRAKFENGTTMTDPVLTQNYTDIGKAATELNKTKGITSKRTGKIISQAVGLSNQSVSKKEVTIHRFAMIHRFAINDEPRTDQSKNESQDDSPRSERDEIKIAIPQETKLPLPKIIGGDKTSVTEHPFIVQIYLANQFNCGGSVLTKRHILSAAHCLSHNGRMINPRVIKVRAGSNILNTEGTVHWIKATTIHSRYNKVTNNNDIGILLLGNHLKYSDRVQQVAIPPQDFELADDVNVIVIGWGWTNSYDPIPSQSLNRVSVRTINPNVCFQSYSYFTQIGYTVAVTPNMLCAGLYGIGGKDACQGDSGGPLISDNVQVGLTSWGAGCGDAWYPGVYTKVSKYTNWIKSVKETDPQQIFTSSSSQVTAKALSRYLIYLSHILFNLKIFQF